MVCTANICRSPAGEAILRHRARSAGIQGKCQFLSAGTGDVRVTAPPDPRMVTLGKERGISFKGMRSSPCTKSLLGSVDFVWCMDETHVTSLQDRYPIFVEKVELYDPDGANIDDPYFGSRQDVRMAFEVIDSIAERRVSDLKEELRALEQL